ncbi:lanthionine synthetase LanC family protein [Parachitinimonas caeni]|uniref:Lanthionine synthetase LanC family protein n=1 Tax=Parachitinimonas caeni TaxID=3031301 RepID=A0ABT7DZS1_9NEIS|nr:lanthionine synthetase LanC family protein [Parachitinimonas caeni]MDK2125319.1 lanthionine synthetase LanC family protein [Parachitinimonas caeni]
MTLAPAPSPIQTRKEDSASFSLPGPLTTQALDLADRLVAEVLAQPANAAEGITLARGTSGDLLLLLEYAHHQPRAAIDLKIEALFEVVTEAVESTPLPTGLWSGICGIMWTLDYAGRRHGLHREAIAELMGEYDEHLLHYTSRAESGRHLDIISGLSSQAIYATERENSATVSQLRHAIAARLREGAVMDAEGGVHWRMFPGRYKREPFPPNQPEPLDLGYAHGVPGVIAALVALTSREPHLQVDDLIQGGMRWMERQARPHPAHSRYSCWVGHEMDSRLAWCYGDLGVAITQTLRGLTADDACLLEAGCSLFQQRCLNSQVSSGVSDSGLCHGAAGIALIAEWLYRINRDEQLAKIRNDWLQRAIRLTEAELEREGFQTGLLGKHTGVALTCLTLATGSTLKWAAPLVFGLSEQ